MRKRWLSFIRFRRVSFLIGSLCICWLLAVFVFHGGLPLAETTYTIVRASLSKAESQRCLKQVLHQRSFSFSHKKQSQFTGTSRSRPKASHTVHVMIASNGIRLIGMMALINSINKNTHASVFFHLVTDKPGARHIRLWMEQAVELRHIKKKIIIFDSSWIEGKFAANSKTKSRVTALADPLNFARFYLDRLLSNFNGRLVYIDDDCIVQGDISEMAATEIAERHVAAFSTGCNDVMQCVHSQPHDYSAYLDYGKEVIKQLGIPRETCHFNAGVFVVDMERYRRWNISGQLEHWSLMNVKDKLFLEGASQPPVMIVFYNRYSELDPRWNVLHLGTTSWRVPTYTEDFIHNEAQLLHWDGPYKPWLFSNQIGAEIWRKYSIPEPVAMINSET